VTSIAGSNNKLSADRLTSIELRQFVQYVDAFEAESVTLANDIQELSTMPAVMRFLPDGTPIPGDEYENTLAIFNDDQLAAIEPASATVGADIAAYLSEIKRARGPVYVFSDSSRVRGSTFAGHTPNEPMQEPETKEPEKTPGVILSDDESEESEVESADDDSGNYEYGSDTNDGWLVNDDCGDDQEDQQEMDDISHRHELQDQNPEIEQEDEVIKRGGKRRRLLRSPSRSPSPAPSPPHAYATPPPEDGDTDSNDENSDDGWICTD